MRRPAAWIHGKHVVEEVLASRKTRVFQVLISKERRHKLGGIARSARKAGARLRWVGRKELDAVAPDGMHQGVAAQILVKPGRRMDEFIEGLSAEDKASAVIVALDQIQDPHNFGAIARSAACLGACALIFPERRNAPITQTVLRSSAGAIEKLAALQVGNLAEALRRLKEAGFWIYGADPAGAPAWKARLNKPMVLVVGSEGKGVRPLVRSTCDEVVAIPQAASGVESLNASCAASVLLYEIARQHADA